MVSDASLQRCYLSHEQNAAGEGSQEANVAWWGEGFCTSMIIKDSGGRSYAGYSCSQGANRLQGPRGGEMCEGSLAVKLGRRH